MKIRQRAFVLIFPAVFAALVLASIRPVRAESPFAPKAAEQERKAAMEAADQPVKDGQEAREGVVNFGLSAKKDKPRKSGGWDGDYVAEPEGMSLLEKWRSRKTLPLVFLMVAVVALYYVNDRRLTKVKLKALEEKKLKATRVPATEQ